MNKLVLTALLLSALMFPSCSGVDPDYLPDWPDFLSWLAKCDLGARCTFEAYLKWLGQRGFDGEAALEASISAGQTLSGDVSVDCSSPSVRAWLSGLTLDTTWPRIPTRPGPATYRWWTRIAAARAKCHVGPAWDASELKNRFSGSQRASR